MNNQEVAKILREIAAAYLLKGENRFKIIAYERAADVVEKSNLEVKDLWEAGKLSTLAGIGSSISSHLDELFRTGKVKHFEQVLKELPKAIFPLLDVPGLGPKRAYKLVSLLKLKNPATVVDDLSKAAKEGRIAHISGFGDKSQEDIIEALERFKKSQTRQKRMPLPYAYNTAVRIIDYLKRHKDTIEAVPLGSLRRMRATIGDIDIAVATKNPKEVIDWFLSYPKKQKVIEKGQSGASIILSNGCQIDLRVQSPEKFGSMLQYFTGSKHHNIRLRELALKRGMSLSEHGIKKGIRYKTKDKREKANMLKFSSEKDFYKALGLSWIPPELRENSGEVEAAFLHQPGYRTVAGQLSEQSNRSGLPKLVELSDIKGDLHIHSNYDLEPSHDLGASPLEDILLQATKLGYEYIGISDHNPSYTNHTTSEIINILKRRKRNFEQIISSTKSVRVHLFIMLEVDILSDGKLALPEEAFNYLDAVIVSIHSSFRMKKKRMTRRIIRGLAHPKAKILAHPTGRLLGAREAYEVDFSKLFAFLDQNNKAVEINAYPDRLDLPDTLVREAIRKNVKLVIGTDSHEVSQLKNMIYGVSVARRGWAQKNDILNTLSYNKMKKWLVDKLK